MTQHIRIGNTAWSAEKTARRPRCAAAAKRTRGGPFSQWRGTPAKDSPRVGHDCAIEPGLVGVPVSVLTSEKADSWQTCSARPCPPQATKSLGLGQCRG